MTAPDFMAEAQGVAPVVRDVRWKIHRRPELGKCEERTAALVESVLDGIGVPHDRPCGGTAVRAVIEGALSGSTVALRADMDALPVQEESGCPFASTVPGVMHACGHDVHTSGALGAAMLLARHREALPGRVVLLFEPDEEGSGGAQAFVDAGCLEGVDVVFGAHVDPALPLGTVGVRYGKFYAASDMFDVAVAGRSAHGAQPEKGIDALAAAAELALAVRALPRLVAPERCVATVGRLEAGTAGNVVAGRAELSGILRTLGHDSRERIRAGLEEAAAAVAEKYGAAVDVTLRPSYGGVVNTDAETALVQRAAGALVGEGGVAVIDEPLMTTEDFGALIDACGHGSFYHLGAGCTEPLHSAGFVPADDAPVLAAAVHAAVLWDYLHSPLLPG